MIVICREMGWDYYTYMSQPLFFLESVKDFLAKEQKEKMKIYKEHQMKHGR